MSNWYQDGKQYGQQPRNIENGIVICGLRHSNCFATIGGLLGLGNYDKDKIEEGFLTSHSRYINRQEAAGIALDAKQVSGEIRWYGLDSSDMDDWH